MQLAGPSEVSPQGSLGRLGFCWYLPETVVVPVMRYMATCSVNPYPEEWGMTRRLAAIAACGVFALTAGACSGGAGSDHAAQSHGKKIAGTRAAAEQPQSARLVLPAGRSSARYRISAPSPAKYAFNVSVTAPASASVSVIIRTWYGAVFSSILTSTHDRGVCRRRGSQDICFERFPLLEAQRAGTWTVIASKRSKPSATVRITVTFVKS